MAKTTNNGDEPTKSRKGLEGVWEKTQKLRNPTKSWY